MNDAELIEAFHALWDNFPGMARLIDRNHTVLAANPAAEAKGFVPDALCAAVGDPAIHRQCKHGKMFREGAAQTDAVLEDRIRGWMPVAGREDVCVHFALPLPEPSIL